jgi:hypothetical protein
MTGGLAERLPELEREAEEYERKARALRQIISGVRALNGEAAEILRLEAFESHRTLFEIGTMNGGPRGADAVLTVMGEDAERTWKVVDVKREVLRRGWAPTPKAVEASIARLRREGEILPIRYGFYKLRPNGAEETADPTNIRCRDGEGEQ